MHDSESSAMFKEEVFPAELNEIKKRRENLGMASFPIER